MNIDFPKIKLGMCEMELAVGVMIARYNAISCKQKFGWETFTPFDFIEDRGAFVGFCQLCCRGLIEPGYPNSEFCLSQELVNRLRRSGDIAADVENPPSVEERVNAMISKMRAP